MIPEALRRLLDEALKIWISGGWGMIALAINGAIMFALGTLILLKLWARGARSAPERAWRAWKRRPDRPRGAVGRMIAGAMRSSAPAEIARYFEAVRSDEIAPFDRDLRVMKVSVTTAPLLGLLGTVTGMLATFNALATGGGGDKTMGMIASGISEALITTETGLVLALSGMMFQYALTRQHERFGKLIAHLETLCMQDMKRTEATAGSGAIPVLAAPAEGRA